MAGKPKARNPQFQPNDNPVWMKQEEEFLYDTRFISTDELANRMFVINVYPDAACPEHVKKTIEYHCRVKNLKAVKLVPGSPGEQVNKDRACWGVDRVAADAFIASEIQRIITERRPLKR